MRVDGFSVRFVALLKGYEFYRTSRYRKGEICNGISYTAGAKTFGTSVNTFRNWCVKDIVPRTSAMLVDVVRSVINPQLCDDDVNKVCAYLMFGVETEISRRIMRKGKSLK